MLEGNDISFDKQKPASGCNYNTTETLTRENNSLGGKQNISGIVSARKNKQKERVLKYLKCNLNMFDIVSVLMRALHTHICHFM